MMSKLSTHFTDRDQSVPWIARDTTPVTRLWL
jgi:hypothetical protein